MDTNKSSETKKRSKAKIIVGVIAFLICACLVFLYLNKVFSMGDNDSNRQIFKAFYAEEEDTIDVAYVGTSAANRYFINPKAFHDEGISSFTVSAMGMPIFYVPNVIDEIEKTQDPDLYIIELRWSYKDKENVADAHIRRVTDNMKLSENKIDAIKKGFSYMDGDTGYLDDISYNMVDYIFPIVKYHGRLAQNLMVPGDFSLSSTKNETKGFVLSFRTTEQVNQFESRLSEGTAPLSDMGEKAVNEVLDYCDQLPEDKQVLFVLSPFSIKKNMMPKFNTVFEMIEEHGYDYINFNTEEMYEELDIDWDHDFYNSKHVNYLGAEKYTDWMTSYLKDNYDLEDHRGDEKYQSWEDAYKTYKDYVKDGILTIKHKAHMGAEEVTVKVKKKTDK